MKNKEHPLYGTWLNMRARCNNPNNPNYYLYGQRNIQVCPEWDDFWKFVECVGDKPSSKHTLDRINSNGNYEPSNVRWATATQQVENTYRVKNAKGYYFSADHNKYKATINVDGQQKFLGYFETESEARHRYLIALHNKLNKSSIL